MRKVSEGKYQALVNMSNPDGIIGALAIDQRGALKKMMARHQEEVKVDDLIHFKELVSEELTTFCFFDSFRSRIWVARCRKTRQDSWTIVGL